MVLSVALCTLASKPGQTQLTIREAVGHLDFQSGQVLSESCEIRTSVNGRMQVDLDNSVFRLGANSAATVGTSGFEFRDGSCLFADLPVPLTVVLGAQRYQITQGTGFAHKNGEGRKAQLIIGGMAGKTLASISGKRYALRAGEALIVNANGAVTRADFDLGQQVETCSLINDFTTHLPNITRLKSEVARFVSMEKRGFVRSNDQWQDGIDQQAVLDQRARIATEDLRMASSPVRNSPQAIPEPGRGLVTLLDVGFVHRNPNPGAVGHIGDNDDRPGGAKPGNGAGNDNHDHSGPPEHIGGGTRPGKGNPRH